MSGREASSPFLGRIGFPSVKSLKRKRNVIAFWIFGLSTHFAFVVSLSAAYDIVDDHKDPMGIRYQNGSFETSVASYRNQTDGNQTFGNQTYGNQTYEHHGNSTHRTVEDDTSEYLVCNHIGTGVVLICVILPELLVKLMIQISSKQLPYTVKLAGSSTSTVLSFLILAFAPQVELRFLGVVFASVAMGLGEMTFVPLTSFYHKNVVSGWSSGTGASGLVASLTYAGFTSLGMATSTFMMMVLVIPAFMIVTYIFMLKPEVDNPEDSAAGGSDGGDEDNDDDGDDIKDIEFMECEERVEKMSLREKAGLMPSVLKYLIPLCMVYFAAYFINQGLHELLYFNDQLMSRSAQYRWFQAVYRIGAFIARSSVGIVQIRNIWVLPLILFATIALFVCQVFFRFIPYLWIVMSLVFVEGLLNGAAYVNTFFCVTKTFVDPQTKEFALGVVTLSNPIGIALAGCVAIPVHNYICTLNLKL